MRENAMIAKIEVARRIAGFLKRRFRGNRNIDMMNWIVATIGKLNGFISFERD